MARSASALGIDNFFIEVHEDPDNAPSDGPNMLKLTDFEQIVQEISKYNYKKTLDFQEDIGYNKH